MRYNIDLIVNKQGDIILINNQLCGLCTYIASIFKYSTDTAGILRYFIDTARYCKILQDTAQIPPVS